MNLKETVRMESLPFSGIRAVMEKANRMQAEGRNIIHLELGRPDFDTPQVIKDACGKSLEKGNVFYTSNYGTPELRTAISEKLKNENKLDYSPEEILVTIGVGEGTYAAFGAFLEEGDEVLVPDPVWLNYIHVPRFFGAVPVPYLLKEEDDFQLDIDELKSKITDKTKMIVLISPNNPTGGVLSRKNLEEVAKLAIEHDLTVLSDEIYEKLVYDDEKHVCIASLPGMRDRTITLNGFSKAYSMTGWRLGYMAAKRDIIQACVRMHHYVNTCASSFVQEAGITALKEAESDVQDMRKEYQRRRDYIVEAINQIDGLSCRKPKGAFYVFVNIKQLDMTSMEFVEYLLDQAGVATVPGTAFGASGEGYIRLSCASSYENLVEAGNRIKDAVGLLKKKCNQKGE